MGTHGGPPAQPAKLPVGFAVGTQGSLDPLKRRLPALRKKPLESGVGIRHLPIRGDDQNGLGGGVERSAQHIEALGNAPVSPAVGQGRDRAYSSERQYAYGRQFRGIPGNDLRENQSTQNACEDGWSKRHHRQRTDLP